MSYSILCVYTVAHYSILYDMISYHIISYSVEVARRPASRLLCCLLNWYCLIHVSLKLDRLQHLVYSICSLVVYVYKQEPFASTNYFNAAAVAELGVTSSPKPCSQWINCIPGTDVQLRV